MLQGRTRKRLWNELVAAGMNPLAATEVASAAHPSRRDQPMRAPALAPPEAAAAAARALETTPIEGEALFEEVFGVSWDDYSADYLG